jgi:hypothetical protein
MHLCINSKDRNATQYPAPDEYVVFINPPIRHVKKITLVHAAICNTQYSLSQPYPIHAPEFGINTSIQPGMYTMMSLQRELQRIFPWNVSIKFNLIAMSIWIRAPQPFTCNGSQSVDIGNNIYQVELRNMLKTAPVVLELESMGKMTECDCQGGHHSFSTCATLPLKTGVGGFTIDDVVPVVHVQNPFITLDRFRIKFKSALHTPIQDHELIFKIDVDHGAIN